MAWWVFINWITSTDSPHKRNEQRPLKSLQCSLRVTPSPRVTTTMIQCVQWHMSHVFNEEVILLFLYFIEMGSFVSIFFSLRYMWFIHPVAYRYRSFIWMAVSISYRIISRFMLDGPIPCAKLQQRQVWRNITALNNVKDGIGAMNASRKSMC